MKNRFLVLFLLALAFSVSEAQYRFLGGPINYWRDSSGTLVPQIPGMPVLFPSPLTGTSGFWTRGTAPNSGRLTPATPGDTVKIMVADSLEIRSSSATMTDAVNYVLRLKSAANNSRIDFTNSHINFVNSGATATGHVTFRTNAGATTWGFGTNSIFGTGFEIFNASTNRLYIETTGNAGFGTNTPKTKVDVAGTLRSTDTLRTGDWTTYSYIIPGGALVQSSDEALKTDIRSFNPDLSKFSLVNPKVFKFKRENFVRTFDESSVPDSVDKQIDSVTVVRVSNKTEKDKQRSEFTIEAAAFADRMAEVKHTGLMATDFNPLIMGKNSKELNQGEVIAVMWKKIQELEARVKVLESR